MCSASSSPALARPSRGWRAKVSLKRNGQNLSLLFRARRDPRRGGSDAARRSTVNFARTSDARRSASAKGGADSQRGNDVARHYRDPSEGKRERRGGASRAGTDPTDAPTVTMTSSEWWKSSELMAPLWSRKNRPGAIDLMDSASKSTISPSNLCFPRRPPQIPVTRRNTVLRRDGNAEGAVASLFPVPTDRPAHVPARTQSRQSDRQGVNHYSSLPGFIRPRISSLTRVCPTDHITRLQSSGAVDLRSTCAVP